MRQKKHTACRWRAARTVSSRCARCMGLRVWNATTFLQESFLNWARSSEGVSEWNTTLIIGVKLWRKKNSHRSAT